MKNRSLLKLVLVTTLLVSIASNANASTVTTVNRLWGQDRYETAIQISKSEISSGTSNYAILAYGENFPDALSAAPLAKKYNAPILLTQTNSIPKSTHDELVRLKVKNVFIVGGKGVISTAVENQLTSMGISFSRLAGNDRYGTSVAIAKQLGSSNQIYVVTGGDDGSFSDALSVAPIAAFHNSPVLLVPQSGLTTEINSFLADKNYKYAYVVQGNLLSDNVVNAIKGKSSNTEVETSSDSYTRNLNIVNHFKGGFDNSEICIATGRDYPDALAGSLLAANDDVPILLVNDNADLSKQKALIDNNAYLKKVYVFGGDGAVNTTAINTLTGLNLSVPIASPIDRLRKYPYPTNQGTIETADKFSARLNSTGASADTFIKYRVSDTVKGTNEYVNAKYNNDANSISLDKILYYYNATTPLYLTYSDSLKQKNGVWADTIESPYVTERKQYNVSSTASFITDSSLYYGTEECNVIRGTIRIKFNSSTDKTYLDKYGILADTWYEKDVDIYWGQHAVWNQAVPKWTCTPYETIFNVVELSGYIKSN